MSILNILSTFFILALDISLWLGGIYLIFTKGNQIAEEFLDWDELEKHAI